ncbi:DnaJ-domain-containing protein [Bimuria novae-zelandiae CBS 107.79]|uniref:DnaJ-domain-containing protein n=1 Tax=Bimuria novae-zelandiae CBS 107.79 TaxID=1447943 RepID=A0A6A5V9K9_9PLEO|nr:DnaJ-domain-containing protein [Bimuria novae-zelandiae CBS 107.79]
MADNKDLEETAKTTTVDFYELLDVDILAEESEIKRQYRKTSVKYHPDKNPDNKQAADLFILLGIGRDILLDPTLKGEYDRQRKLRVEREAEKERLGGKRRNMVEELEKAEREGLARFKRQREEATEKEQLAARFAEENRVKREEYQEKIKKQRQDEELKAQMDRSVKVRFRREGEAATWDKDIMTSMFERYGEVDTVVMGSDKKTKVPGEKHRRVEATVTIVYYRLDNAHAAVMGGKVDYPFLESVTWASKESGMKPEVKGKISAPSTPVATPGKTFKTSFGIGKGLGAAPGRPQFASLKELEEYTLKRCREVDERRRIQKGQTA